MEKLGYIIFFVGFILGVAGLMVYGLVSTKDVATRHDDRIFTAAEYIAIQNETNLSSFKLGVSSGVLAYQEFRLREQKTGRAFTLEQVYARADSLGQIKRFNLK